MGIKQQGSTDPDERNLGMISQELKDQLVLKIMRAHASQNGQLICSPNLPDFLYAEIKILGYHYTRRYAWDYGPTIQRLKKLKLIVRLTDKGGRKEATFRVDMITPYQEAVDLSKRPNRLLCSDLTNLPVDHAESANTIAVLAAEVKERDDKIATQAKEIQNLRKAVTDTLQDAEKFAKESRNRLKEA